MSRRWWQEPFSVFQTNLQEIDAGMDVDAALDVIEDHGADTWLLNAGGIVSFHPTDLPFQTRNPFLAERPSGDLLGDAVPAAHARGIRVIARLDLSKVAAPIAAEHPDWLYVSPTGQPQAVDGLHSVCPSGDYYQHRSFEIIDEILDRYPVDGFFCNWFNFNEVDYRRTYHGVCHCDACRVAFAAQPEGGDLPAGPSSPDYWRWLRFSGATMGALTQRITAHLADRAPEVGLVLRKGAPIAYEEANNSFGTGFWPRATGDAVSAHVTAFPEVPVLVNCVSFVDMPYRMAGEQPERFAQYLIQAMARGGNPSTYIMGAPGRIPYANLPVAGELTRFHRDHREVYAGLRPAAATALVRPNRFGMPPAAHAPALEEHRGVAAALQEVHHPFDVLAVESLDRLAAAGRLRSYDLVIVPDLGPLGPEVAGVLDAYVEAGGNLLTTGSTGVTEDGDVELAASPALRRRGEPQDGEELWSSYATFEDQPRASEHRYTGPVVPVYGAAASFEWRPAATKLGCLLAPAPFAPPEKCYGHLPGDEPAAVTVPYGAGEAATIPWSIGRTYRELGTTEVRDLLIRVVRSLATTQLSADLPEQVELILGQDDQGYVVHLLNQTGVRHRSFGPHVPVDGGRLRVHGARVSRAEALVAGGPLALHEEEGDVVIDLPRLERFEVVRFASEGRRT